MSWFKWFDDMLLKRVVGLAVRKAIDYAVAALAVVGCFGLDICGALAGFISEHFDGIEALIVAAAGAVITFIWSFTQKKKDVAEIKRKDRVINYYKTRY